MEVREQSGNRVEKNNYTVPQYTLKHSKLFIGFFYGALYMKKANIEVFIHFMKLLICVTLVMTFIATVNASELTLPTRKLNGTSISYDYTSGRSYDVKFQDEGVTLRFITGSNPKKWWGPFPYQAFEPEENVYFVSWFEEKYGHYVTLLINFNNNLLYGSAILSGKTVHFHGAKIVKVNRK